MVSALKGLQEKIRKLELERADAEDNLKKLATESRHYKDVLQKELTVRESSQGVISRQNKRRLLFLCFIGGKEMRWPSSYSAMKETSFLCFCFLFSIISSNKGKHKKEKKSVKKKLKPEQTLSHN